MKKIAFTIAAMSIGQFIVSYILKLKKVSLTLDIDHGVFLSRYLLLIIMSSFWIMIMLYLSLPKQMYCLCIPHKKFNPELKSQDIEEFRNTRILLYIKLVTFIYFIHFLQLLIY